MKHFILPLLLIFLFSISSMCYSHSGRTDASGCHTQSSTGTRHCHTSTTTPVYTPPPVVTITYSWYASAWSSCSGDCGNNKGTTNRVVYCRSSTGSYASDYRCSGTKPSTSGLCTASICPAVYAWKIEEWTSCAGECGVNKGTINRVVYCNSSIGGLSKESLCSGAKPSYSEPCTASMCPIPTVEPKVEACVTMCNDGWCSPSSGKGACSSHDGMKTYSRYTLLSGILEIDEVKYASNYYKATLQIDNDSQCFNLANYSMLTNTSDDAEYKPLLNSITKLLHLPNVTVGNSTFNATLEHTDSGQFCVANAFSGDCNVVAGEYSRSDWSHWSDNDGDCQDTRAEVLTAFNESSNSSTCSVEEGKWYGLFTNKYYYNASELDIDHVVPLYWVHNHGGANWSPTLKERFANDMENLIPVVSSENRSKSAQAPYDWLPDFNQCTYIEHWETIVEKYKLCLSDEESERLATVKSNCKN